MQIRRLKLAGFKSFVEPAELRIEPGLTGVVGPNGCGKSNLLEAIRWVMGENSPKSLRSGGMEDVIFAGTTSRPARGFAEVVLLADTAAGEELEVVRRIERGAGSAYRINGRDVWAKDVSLVFADAATGALGLGGVSLGGSGRDAVCGCWPFLPEKSHERKPSFCSCVATLGLSSRCLFTCDSICERGKSMPQMGHSLWPSR